MYIVRKKSIVPVFTGAVATTSMSSTTTSFVVNYPSGSSNGDYIVINLYVINIVNDVSFSVTTPTGWTLITSVTSTISADALAGYTYGKFRGSETSVTITLSAANYTAATAVSYLGSTVSGAAPANVSTSAISTTASTTCSPASVTTTIENCALVETAMSINTAGATSFTFSWGGGYTSVVSGAAQVGTAADELGWNTATGVQVTPAATGTVTCTSSVSTDFCYATNVALAPATG